MAGGRSCVHTVQYGVRIEDWILRQAEWGDKIKETAKGEEKEKRKECPDQVSLSLAVKSSIR